MVVAYSALFLDKDFPCWNSLCAPYIQPGILVQWTSSFLIICFTDLTRYFQCNPMKVEFPGSFNFIFVRVFIYSVRQGKWAITQVCIRNFFFHISNLTSELWHGRGGVKQYVENFLGHLWYHRSETNWFKEHKNLNIMAYFGTRQCLWDLSLESPVLQRLVITGFPMVLWSSKKSYRILGDRDLLYQCSHCECAPQTQFFCNTVPMLQYPVLIQVIRCEDCSPTRQYQGFHQLDTFHPNEQMCFSYEMYVCNDWSWLLKDIPLNMPT